MLFDSFRLTPSAPVQNSKISADTAFPTGVAEGTTFLLTATVGQNTPGMYVYLGETWEPLGALKSIEAGANSGMDLSIVNGVVTLSVSPAMTPYDVAAFVNGKPDAGAKVCELRVVRTFKLPASLTGSAATVGTAPTGSAAVFSIFKNGASIGSFTFNVGATTATFAFASEQTFVAGDRLVITAPASQNAALADLAFTLAGSLR